MTSAPAAPAMHEPPHEAPPPREPLAQRLRLALRPSNFVASIPGPIFHKDVWISGRKSSTYWIRFVYTMLLLFTVSIVFIANADDASSIGSATLRLQQLQQVAPITTKVLLWFEFVTLAVIGAILGAPTICEEKRAGTLGTLLTTPLKAWQIVIGKTCAFSVQLIILALVAVPLLLAVRVFGGVSAAEVLTGTALVISTSLLAGLCGMFFSIIFRRTPGAIMAGLLLLVVTQGLAPLTWALTAAYYKSPVLSEAWLIRACTPGALGMVTFGAELPGIFQHAWIYSTAYALALCLTLIVLNSILLRRVMAREGEGGSAIPTAKKIKKSRKAATPASPDTPPDTQDTSTPINLPTPKRRRASSVHEGVTRTVSDHPVLWREMRQSIFRSPWPFIVLVLVVGSALGTAYYWGALEEDVAHAFIAVVATVLSVLGAAIAPASIISGEREARTLDVLLTTPLTARAIIFGKAAGAVRRQWIIPSLLAAHIAIAVACTLFRGYDSLPPHAFLFGALILIPPLLFLTATGTFMSQLCKKSVGASAANFGLALAIWLIIPGFITFICEAILNFRGGAEDTILWMWMFNPAAASAITFEGLSDGRFESPTGNLNTPEMLIFAVIYAALYTLAAFLVLRWTAAILAERTARLK